MAPPSAPVTRPNHTPARVTEFTATDGTEKFCQAVDALDAALGLSAPGAARLLVIIGDGEYTGDEPTGGQKRITRLAAADCAVLWITPGYEWATAMDGARLTVLTDPAATADAIAKAAARPVGQALGLPRFLPEGPQRSPRSRSARTAVAPESRQRCDPPAAAAARGVKELDRIVDPAY
jgi:hypothetical protein